MQRPVTRWSGHKDVVKHDFQVGLGFVLLCKFIENQRYVQIFSAEIQTFGHPFNAIELRTSCESVRNEHRLNRGHGSRLIPERANRIWY